MKIKIRQILRESLLNEKDNRRILIDNEGVSEEIANWAHELSDKLSIWIVKSLKDKYAKVTANQTNKISLDEYYEDLTDDYLKIIRLMKIQNKPPTDIRSLDFDGAMELVNKYHHIQAWIDDPAAPTQGLGGIGFLVNKTWDEAMAMADEWHSSLQAGGSVENILDEKDEILHTFPNGFQWILRKSNTCPKSRESMGHCATATNSNMYLLRLIKDNSEFITVDWDPIKKFIIQAKGIKNTKPVSKYYYYIIWLIKDWGGIDKLKTNTGYLPHINFQLGELNPDVAADIIGNKPNIMNIIDILQYTPNPNKPKLIANLFKYESFFSKLIPYGFADFFNMVENKNMVIGAVLSNPTFLTKMNKYPKILTDTLERMINATNVKDKLINELLKRDGLIDMLDKEGVDLLARNHSDPDEVRDIILRHEFGGDEEPDEEPDEESADMEIAESKKKIKNILRG
jgi:hypothetical protein